MRILLTGATGFIGAHVARCMLSDECDVYALIRAGSNTWRLDEIANSLNMVECDLFSEQQVDQCMEEVRPDCCIHLAWFAEPGKFWNSLENLRCVRAGLHLAMRLADLGCKRLVGIGTCAEYDPVPGPLSERGRTRVTSLYAGSKLALFIALEQLGKATQLEVAWPRVFYLYGPFEDERRLVPSIILSLLRNQEMKLTKGEPLRDFSHVEDVAAAVWAVAKSDLVGPVNIGSGRPLAVRDLATEIGGILERPELLIIGALPYRSPEAKSIYADNSLLRTNTDWIPRYSLGDGLRQTIRWWKTRLG
jgi:nucleoside-diphosphate-sugar epimerase